MEMIPGIYKMRALVIQNIYLHLCIQGRSGCLNAHRDYARL